VGFQVLAGKAELFLTQSGLNRHDLGADDHLRLDLAERHPQKVQDADPGPGGDRLDPEAEVVGKNQKRDPRDEEDDGSDYEGRGREIITIPCGEHCHGATPRR